MFSPDSAQRKRKRRYTPRFLSLVPLVVAVLRIFVLRRVLGIAALGSAAVLGTVLGRTIAGAVVVCIRCVGRIICVRTHNRFPPVMNVYRDSMRIPTENYTNIFFKNFICIKIAFCMAVSSISNRQ